MYKILILVSIVFFTGCTTSQKQISFEKKMNIFFSKKEKLNKNREEIFNNFSKCMEGAKSQKDFQSCNKEKEYKLSYINKTERELTKNLEIEQKKKQASLLKKYIEEDKKRALKLKK